MFTKKIKIKKKWFSSVHKKDTGRKQPKPTTVLSKSWNSLQWLFLC